MPDKPSWIESIPEILAQLEAPGAPPFLDRAAVERLFGVRRRQAIELFHQFGGYQVGKTFLAPREAAIAFLREPRRQSAEVEERARIERVSAVLAEARRGSRQRRIAIPSLAGTVKISGLPAGIRLEHTQLTIEFARPAELLEKLYAFSQALAHDYEAFEQSWMAATGERP